MIINTTIYDQIFDVLKDFVETESLYSPLVTKKSLKQSNKFPLVVFTEEDNSILDTTTRMEETISKLEYEVNIYAIDAVLNGKKVSNVEIARELQALVDNVLNCNLRMRRRSCRPTPNLDETIYRVTMRYSTGLRDNSKKLI